MRKSTFPGNPVLSTTADHALRALLVLARRGSAVPAEEVAELTGTPANYLGKTLGTLARAGLVRAVRGPSGGFSLAESPESISIARIARVFAEPRAHRRCLLGTGACNAARPCAAHDRWKHLMAAVNEPLASTTIADFLGPDVRADAAMTTRTNDDRADADPT